MRPDLDALLAEWKPIFGCSDWRINCQYTSGLPDGTLAKVKALWKYLEAVIWIADPATVPHDVEETLVHELGHLPFAPFETEEGSFQDAMEERAVETIARGMIALKRNKAPTQVQAVARRQIDSHLSVARARLKARKARSTMFDAARFGEIMMELGATPDLPDSIKPLIAELAGMAAGGEAMPSDPLKEEPKPTPPIPGSLPAFRVSALTAQADGYARKRVDLERSMAADAARTKARKDLGARCTPALERRLIGMTEPDQIESTVAAIIDSSPAAEKGKSRETAKEPTIDPPAAPTGRYTARLAASGLLSKGGES